MSKIVFLLIHCAVVRCLLITHFLLLGDGTVRRWRLVQDDEASTFRSSLRIRWDDNESSCGGLSKIHGKNMIHRDLKTENIFVSSFPKSPQERIRVKIGDLGFCVTAEELSSLQGTKSPLNVGSPIYMSPETQQIQQYSKASDIYAIGIIWY